MTTNDLSKTQLTQILSALDREQRNPASKAVALQAIGKRAETLGLTTEDILEAAAGLLDGRLDAGSWLVCLTEPAEQVSPEPVAASEPCVDPATGTEAGSVGRTTDVTTGPEPEPVEARPRGRRVGTKQAQLISMLERPDGAAIGEIATALGWQRHTVRGAIAGALKRKLGLDVTSEKHAERGRVYRLC